MWTYCQICMCVCDLNLASALSKLIHFTNTAFITDLFFFPMYKCTWIVYEYSVSHIKFCDLHLSDAHHKIVHVSLFPLNS
jgi:hypothetical protein